MKENQEKAKAYNDASRRAKPTGFSIGNLVQIRLPTRVTKGHTRFGPAVQIE